MSVLAKLSSSQGNRDEELNISLAKEIVKKKDSNAVEELVTNMENKDKNIQSDCLKVLYEIGYIEPKLIAKYVNDFIDLLCNKNNRLVWGAAYALSTIAEIKAGEIFNRFGEVVNAIDNGSVITKDGGIKTLSIVASKDKKYLKRLNSILMDYLRESIPKDLPKNAEYIAVAIDSSNLKEFTEILEGRKKELKASQLKRIEKIFKRLSK